MEQRLSMVTLAVEDLTRSRAFYAQGLGWTVVSSDTEGIVCFQLGAMVLALYERSAFAKDIEWPDPAGGLGADSLGAGGREVGGRGMPGIALAHNTRSKDEVDAVIAQAVAAGARVQKPAEDAFWGGYSGYIADPDGHLWEIAWNPFSPIGEDGAFIWQA